MSKSRVLLSSLIVLAALVAAPGHSSARPVLDSAFGKGGRVVSNLAFTPSRAGYPIVASPLANGKVLLYQVKESGFSANVFKLNSDGTPDGTFGNGGRLTTDLTDGLTLLPGGKFLLRGQIDIYGETGEGGDAVVRRYNEDGTVDPEFGNSGSARITLWGRNEPRTLTVLDDGSYLIQTSASCGGWKNYCGEGDMDSTYFIRIDRGGNVDDRRVAMPGAWGDPVQAPDGTIWALGRTETLFFGPVPQSLVKVRTDLTVEKVRQFGENELGSLEILNRPGGGFLIVKGYNPVTVSALTAAGADDPSFVSAVPNDCAIPSEVSGYGQRLPVIQNDSHGRILVRGNKCDLYRLLPDGGLDASFGNGGVADLAGISMTSAGAFVTIDDGVILTSRDDDSGEGVVRKLDTSGDPEAAFGGPDGSRLRSFEATRDSANAVSVSKDGSLLVGGTSVCNGLRAGSAVSCSGTAVSRFSKNGKLRNVISSFGIGSPYPAEINALKQGKSGAMIVAGSAHRAIAGSEDDVGQVSFVAKILSGGELDKTFGEGGITLTDVPEFAKGAGQGFTDLDFQKNGRIVATGAAQKCGGYYGCVPVVRYLRNGELDKSFGSDGIVNLGGGAIDGRAIAVQPNGRILIGASFERGDQRKLIMIRLLRNGVMDPSYGNEGIASPRMAQGALVRTKEPRKLPGRTATDIRFLGSGKILVSAAENYGFRTGAVLKLDDKGHLVRSFGRRGVSYLGTLQPAAIVRDRCGRITAAGSEIADIGQEISYAAISRLNSDGSFDRTFGSDAPWYPFGRRTKSALTSAVLTKGSRVMAAGWKDQAITGNDVAMVKFRAGRCR